MATLIKILSPKTIKRFDNPPVFTSHQRKQMFRVQKRILKILETFPNLTNKIGFVLQLGYFRAVNKFYSPKKFHQKDIEFIAGRLSINIKTIDLKSYKYTTSERHQDIILSETGFKKFNPQIKKMLISEAEQLTSRQQKPRLTFMSLVDFLQTRKIQVPNYNTFARIITDSLKNYENNLVQIINDSLSNDDKTLIDNLLEKEDSATVSIRYTLTALKSHSHSIRAQKIKENIEDFEYLEPLFQKIYPVLTKLQLTPKILKYYSAVVFRSQVFQISRRDKNRYLYLIAFIVDSFYDLNDMLVLKVNKAVQQSKNSGEKEEKNLLFESRHSKVKLMKNVASGLSQKRQAIIHPLKATLFRLIASVITVIVVARFLRPDTLAVMSEGMSGAAVQPFVAILKNWFIASFYLCIKMFLIIMALMILLGIMKSFNIIHHIVRVISPALKAMGLNQKVGILWITAAVFGIAYGAVVIVEEAKEGNFDRQELEKLHISIGINHSMVEDPALFLTLGLNAFWLWVPRLLTAVLAVHLFALWHRIKSR